MRILSRYFVSGYLTFYAGIVVVSMLVIAIVEMMVNLDHILEFGDGVAGAASYLFLKLVSYYLGYLIPAASYGAAILCLGVPARSLEILAAKASGISPRRLALPVLAAAAALSALALALDETVVLEASRRFARATDADASALYQAGGAFWESRGDTLLSAESVDRDSRTLRGVRVYQRDASGRLLRSVHAELARIEPDRRWRLERARVREFAPDDPEAPPHSELRETDWLDLGRTSDLSLLGADPRELTLRSLGDYVNGLRREGRGGERYRALWHARLAEPLNVLLFALLGLPLGMAVERSRSLAVAALEGVGILGAYYALRAGSSLFAPDGVLTPWLLIALFALFGLWRLARVGR